MDGMLGHSPFLSNPADPASRAGILYAEDFDELQAAPSAPAPAIDETPAKPVLTQHDLERACIAAVEQARVRWQQEAEQQRQRSLAIIAENAAAMRAEAAREAAALAEGTVATMLSMLAGALPALCREHGPHETRILVQHLLPNLRSEPHITIRVHPAVVPALQDDLKRSDIELAGEVSIIGAPLEPGDVRVSWENGSCKRDTRAILTAIQDALAQLGLLCPIEITPERRLELAE